MYDLLGRVGFSSKRPRPRHSKAASGRDKSEFKKAGRTAKYYAKKGYKVMADDETSHILG